MPYFWSVLISSVMVLHFCLCPPFHCFLEGSNPLPSFQLIKCSFCVSYLISLSPFYFCWYVFWPVLSHRYLFEIIFHHPMILGKPVAKDFFAKFRSRKAKTAGDLTSNSSKLARWSSSLSLLTMYVEVAFN